MKTATLPTSAEDLLRSEISERCRRNPNYSMRAFARACGISHTVLSLVLTGKRKLSKISAQKLADFLDLNPGQRNVLLRPHLPISKATPRQSLSLDSFEVIADWYHYAILSALELPDSKLDARWLAKRLRIKIVEAKFAIERLLRLGLIEQKSDGSHKQSGQPLKVDNTVSTAATRKFHTQLLGRASEALERDPITVRDFSAITFAMDRSQLEYARTRIVEFRRQLSAELEAFGAPNEVYQLSIQLFPLTQIEPEKIK